MTNRLLAAAILAPISLIAAADAGSPGPSAPGAAADSLRERARRELFDRPAVAIAIAAGDPVEPGLRDLLDRVRRFGGSTRIRLMVDPPEGPLPEADDDEALVVVSIAPGVSRRALALLDRLPARVDPEGFVFAGRRSAAPDAGLATLAPDPNRSGGLAIVCVGRSPRATVRSVAGLLFAGIGEAFGEDDFRMRPGGMLDRRGRYRMPGAGPWALDAAHQTDGEAERDDYFAALVEVRAGTGTTGVRVAARVPPPLVSLARPWLARRAAAIARTPPIPDAPQPPVEFVVYDDLVRLGRYTGRVSPASPDPVPGSPAEASRPEVPIRIRTLLDPEAESFADLEAALALGAAGRSTRPWLARGEAVACIGTWKGRTPAAWSSLLRAAGVLPSLDELLAPEMGDDQSPLIFLPVAGRLREVVIARFGEARWNQLAGGGALDEPLRRAWAEAALAEPPASEPRRPDPSRLPRFQRGVCFAHVNDLARGYASAPARSTLDHLTTLGVDVISVTPFGFTRAASDPQVRFVLDSPGAETDSQMLSVLAAARARGISVVYKPHIWVGEGGWAGLIEMPDEASWKRFFEGYRRFAVHHALVAAEGGATGFVVGTEMVRSSSRADDWRGVIASVRRVFPGWVTYAANWDEFEKVRFWDSLDAAAVDLYEPLSADPEATDARLLAGAVATAERMSAVARRAGRPLLLTEVGAPSRPAAWLAPHEEVDGAPGDDLSQERVYRALVGAWRSRPELRGAFWWKYESAPIGARDSNGLTPRGKKAEAVLANWYREAGNRTPPPASRAGGG